jgi:hypothetical protein
VKTHDRWNGRAGDFEYQTSILRLGGERAMVRVEHLFLTQNTLPLFDRLLDILDSIPGEIRHRSVGLFFFAGLASRYESERITEEVRDSLPERVGQLRGGRFQDWRSEREWIPIMRETASQRRKLVLKLDVNEANIDHLEKTSCEQIFIGPHTPISGKLSDGPRARRAHRPIRRHEKPQGLHDEPRRGRAMARATCA